MRAPFPWFGSKRKVADIVWQHLGDVDNYIEPFAGSMAVLLERPNHHKKRQETVNDIDAYVSNFWRALKADPEQVARYASDPINENDLNARHLWLVSTGKERIENINIDPDYYDAKVAGWWVWGLCVWIGSGWCDKAYRQLPHLSGGQGINRQLPHLGPRRGINRQRPDISDRGQGILMYMEQLAARLESVAVCSGDWKRVCTDGATDYGSTVGVFLDPPYYREGRKAVYNHETDVFDDVLAWCRDHEDNPRYKIAVCGYNFTLPGWKAHNWSAGPAYQSSNGGGNNAENRHKEVIYFSPSCVSRNIDMFEVTKGS